MKNVFKRNAGIYFAAALLTLTTVTSSARAQDRDGQLLRADLTSFNQVPSVFATGAGRFLAQLNPDQTISFSLSYTNMSSAVAQAHIHFGAGRTNGGVMVFLCGGSKPACPSSGTVTGTITAADVSTLPATNGDSVIPQGIPPGDLDALLAAIASGNTYVNVHTTNFPNGEIRGQVQVR